MHPTNTRAFGPTDAEQVRSILHAATSLTVTTDAGRHELYGSRLLTFGPGPRRGLDHGMRLAVPAGSRLADEASAAAAGVPALLEWTDVAPTAVRARIRGRLRLAARLGRPEPAASDDLTSVLLEPSHALLGTSCGDSPVDLHAIARAEADPLAAHEAALLTHLTDDHEDYVAALSRLVDAHLLVGVTRVLPLAVDRHGLVLRLEYLHAHRDVRLLFDEPLLDVEHVGHRIHALLTAANPRTHRPRLHTHPR
ncbi:hypothetical protein P3T37_005023 [Kitasatospora sp. MAA4]|uniref:DUF2470 domain-containing protein n=1 Tax=Kitasatospora sp. MAA4 TaxID=3035093 RepID=UPI002474F0AB|nr:DUF2470 domain-containing protein [Kitasatospora sp. MAA4]MDH6135607.1 hypothetical protein [Kitasatospora sp. MAA4]